MTVARVPILIAGQVGFGDVGDDPNVAVIRNPVELVAGFHLLPVDDTLLDHVAGGRRRPIERAGIGSGFAHLADAALRYAEIAQLLHRSLDVANDVRCCRSARGRTRRHHEIDLRPHDVRAVYAKQRLAGAHVLAGLVDEQLLDVAVRPHGHDRQPGFVVLDRTDGTNRASDGSLLDHLGPHAAALKLVEAHLDGLAVVLLLALVDWNVIHPHPVLLRDRRGVGQAHRIAVIDYLPRTGRRGVRLLRIGLERDFLVLVNREIVAAAGVLFRLGRPIRRAARIAVVEDLAVRGRALRRDRRRRHAAGQAGVPIAAGRACRHSEDEKDWGSKATHGVT